MTAEEANNFMALEPRLLQLLEEAVQNVAPAVKVLTAADMQGVMEQSQHTPALHLVYAGFRVAETSRSAARLVHTWWVVAVTKNVARQRTGKAARADAGPLLAAAVAALMGQQVDGATKPLALMNGPKPHYSAGFQYLAAAFEAETIFRKPNP